MNDHSLYHRYYYSKTTTYLVLDSSRTLWCYSSIAGQLARTSAPTLPKAQPCPHPCQTRLPIVPDETWSRILKRLPYTILYIRHTFLEIGLRNQLSRIVCQFLIATPLHAELQRRPLKPSDSEPRSRAALKLSELSSATRFCISTTVHATITQYASQFN